MIKVKLKENNIIHENTKVLARRPIPIKSKKKLVKLKPKTPIIKVLPWDKEDVYNPNINTQEIATGPDLVPLVKKLKEEYPIISQTKEYINVFKKKNPLVSVIITTYNHADYLKNISLKSVMEQTYKNLEIIVVADHSTDNTDELMESIKDPRIIYKNLSKRTIYPGKTKRDIWLIAGAVPHNIGLSLVTGDFVTYCDHDDTFTKDRIEKLVQFSQEYCYDFIYHPFYIGTIDNVRNSIKAEILACSKVTTSSVFHHSWFKQIPVDINCWKTDQPGDWNKFSKFITIGVKIGRYSEYLSYKR